MDQIAGVTMAYAFGQTEGRTADSAITAVVRDIGPTVEFYGKAFGVGPFTVRDVEARDADWSGRAAPTRFRVATAPWVRVRWS